MMTSTITLPLWLALCLACCRVGSARPAAHAIRALVHPQPCHQGLDEVGQRLKIHIRPFQQVRRQR